MPTRRSNPKTMHMAGLLRKASTRAEAQLWGILRQGQLQGVEFRRQHAIGPYVVDFCAPRHKLVIELDGSPHMDRKEADAVRTLYLEAQGYRILRFWNGAVFKDTEGLRGAVLSALHLTSQALDDRQTEL